MKGSVILLLIELVLALLCIPLFRSINENIKRRQEKTAGIRAARRKACVDQLNIKET